MLGKTELTVSEESPVKMETSKVHDEMVALFGSEKKKRAFAAFKRNKVESEALDTALASAVTHIDSTTMQETTEQGILSLSGHFSSTLHIIFHHSSCSTIAARVRAGTSV